MIKKKFFSLVKVFKVVKYITVVFVISVLVSGCKLFFNNKAEEKPENTDSQQRVQTASDEYCDFSIPVSFFASMVTHGAIPSEMVNDGTDSSADSLCNNISGCDSTKNENQARSATFASDISDITDITVTATRKKNFDGTAIPGSEQTEASGNQIITHPSNGTTAFTFKINKTGTWFLQAEFTINGTTYKGSRLIILTNENPYKEGLVIYAYAESFDPSTLYTSSNGDISLVVSYDENLTDDATPPTPLYAQMVLQKRNMNTGEEEEAPVKITGTIDSTARTITFSKNVPAGLYFAELSFFADEEKITPLYICNESVVVASGKTTDTWVISSSYITENGAEKIKHTNKGALQEKNGQVKFIITSELVKPFLEKYTGYEYYVGGENASDYNNGLKNYPFATMQKAVNRILEVNDKSSQYTILLKGDIKENQNTANYDRDRMYSLIKIVGTSTNDQIKIKITSDEESLEAYNLANTPKETGCGFAIDANRDKNHTGTVIFVEKATLTLEKVTVRGGYNYYSYSGLTTQDYSFAGGINCRQNTKLVMENGTVIEENYFFGNYCYAGAVILSHNCVFIMNGGVIRNNKAFGVDDTSGSTSVGGVSINSTSKTEFIMNGGEIYGNTGYRAGAVFVKGIFTMNGGVIGKRSSEVSQAADDSHYSNMSKTGGGAVFMSPTVESGSIYTPELHLNGGEICYNYAENKGGAIHSRYISTFGADEKSYIYLDGTNILYNAAGVNSDSGSGGAIYTNATIIRMNDGVIRGNRAGGKGGAICVENISSSGTGSTNDNRLYINGGRITENYCKNESPGADSGSKALGGAIYLGANAKCQINGGIIDQNKTYASNKNYGNSFGGAIYMETISDGVYKTYTPSTTGKFAPSLEVNGGVINANKCEAALGIKAARLGSAIFTEPKLTCQINNKKVVMSNNEVYDSMQFVKGFTFDGAETVSVSVQGVASQNSLVFIEGRKDGTTDNNLTINDLWVCDHEVTQGEYELYMTYYGAENSNNYKVSDNDGKGSNLPAYYMNWYDAIIYCNLRSQAEGLTPAYYLADTSGDEVANGRNVNTWMNDTSTKIVKNDSGKYYCNFISSLGTLQTNPSLDYSDSGSGDNTGGIRLDINANGYRIPTLAEWEYAARGGNSLNGELFLFSGSNNKDEVAWYNGNSTKAQEIRTKQGNGLGLYDMTGNVGEWCWDWKPSDGTIHINTPSTGPLEGDYYRGLVGGYYDYLIQCIGFIEYKIAGDHNKTYGFRVVRTASSSSTPAATASTEKYLVTFDTTTNYPGNTVTVSPQIITSGSTVTAPSVTNPTPESPDPSKPVQITFLGWYTSPKPAQNPANPLDATSTAIDKPFVFAGNANATKVTSNITLYAVWDFVYVPGTTFEGAQTLCNSDTQRKSPVFIQDRIVPIGDLWVCDHEVTQEEYGQYMAYYGEAVSGSSNGQSESSNPYKPSGTNGIGNKYPAYFVSWYDAIIYCNLRSKTEGLTPAYYLADENGDEVTDGRNVAHWKEISAMNISESNGKYLYTGSADDDYNDYFDYSDSGNGDSNGGIRLDLFANGYRLPTQAEWEYLARGGLSGTQYIYSGSDNNNEVAWNANNSGDNGGTNNKKTHEVKTLKCNTFGLYDMSGNVWEWCWDWAGSIINASTPVTGPSSMPEFEGDPYAFRVGYGGSYFWNELKICNAEENPPSFRSDERGFRVVRSAGVQPVTPPRHTVTFDTTTNWPGNTLIVDPVQVYHGKKVAPPTNTGNESVAHFLGWYTKPNPTSSDTPFNFTTTEITNDLTLYGRWVNVGSVLLNDGTIIPYTASVEYTQEQKDKAVGILYYMNGTTPKGWLGLYNSYGGTNSGTKAWAKSGTTGYNTKFDDIKCTPSPTGVGAADTATFTDADDTDGSNNWAAICSIDDTAATNAAVNYPAFDYVNNYAATFGLTGDYATGWYMPSIAELCYIYRNKSALNNVLQRINAIQLYSAYYWSSSQDDSVSNGVWVVSFSNGDVECTGKNDNRPVCVVRAF